MSSLHTQPAVLDAIGGIDPYADFRIHSQREMVALLKQLAADATPVHLSGPHGSNLTTVIWTVDSAQNHVKSISAPMPTARNCRRCSSTKKQPVSPTSTR
jgi:hypothetical protein